MESKVLETLKKNFMRDNILEALRVRLDASYNEYMEKEYPKKLADWQESKQFYSYNRPETPKPRPSTDFFLKKTELYLDKIGLSDDSDFVIMVEGYKEKVTITIYILTGNGMLLKIKTYNGEPPDRIDYIIRQDISRVEMERKHRAVYVISDRKFAVDTPTHPNIAYYYVPDIISAQGYYSYGSLEEGRRFSILQYGFGYQGSMKDNQIYGTGNAYTTEFRELDVRLGRWWGMDPITFPWLSPYQAMDNNPLVYNDPFGDDIKYSGDKAQQKKEKADIKYLRKHDKAFNKQFKEWKKEYKGNNNLWITRTDNEKDASLQKASGTGPKQPDPHNKKYSTLTYSGVGGADQGMYTIYQRSIQQKFNVSGAFTNDNEPAQQFHNTAFATNSFLKAEHWTYNVYPSDPQYLLLTTTFDQHDNESTLTVEGTNTYPPSTAMRGGQGWYTGEIDYSGNVIAITHPIYIKVPRGFLGFHNWKNATYDYEQSLKNWEGAIQLKALDYDENMTYKH